MIYFYLSCASPARQDHFEVAYKKINALVQNKEARKPTRETERGKENKAKDEVESQDVSLKFPDFINSQFGSATPRSYSKDRHVETHLDNVWCSQDEVQTASQDKHCFFFPLVQRPEKYSPPTPTNAVSLIHSRLSSDIRSPTHQSVCLSEPNSPLLETGKIFVSHCSTRFSLIPCNFTHPFS